MIELVTRAAISQIPGSGPGATPVNKSAASIDLMDIPELSFGCNPRMPSASSAIDLKFEPDKGRFFVAARDLEPGKDKTIYEFKLTVGKEFEMTI